MFTGIIEEIGKVKKLSVGGKSGSIQIEAKTVLSGTKLGDSIAVNGVCLTVTSIENNVFSADVMAETMRRTNLGSLSAGSKVNLERAMSAEGRFGGHIVSGHIDGTGKILKMQKEENAVWVHISADKAIISGIVEKGSIAIDGISLTVALLSDEEVTFAVSVIPHTGEETTLLGKKVGDKVNLENDIIGKYVKRFFGLKENASSGKSDSGVSETEKNALDAKLLSWLEN